MRVRPTSVRPSLDPYEVLRGKDEGPTIAGTGLLGLAQSVSLYFAPAHDEREVIRQAGISVLNRFGLDPCTRAQAAAHEAGHVVVARVLRATIRGARITRCVELGRDVWIGSNDYTPARGYGMATASQDPSLAMRSAAHNLAGFAGEHFAGLAHPSSSIDERCIAWRICQALSEIGDASTEQVASEIWCFCIAALERNRIAFDAVRGHLYRQRRLTKAEADRMLAGVCAP